MKAVISIGLMALALSGCATRRAVSIDCPQFQSFAIDVPPTAIIRAIQSDVPVQSGEIFSDEAIQDFLIQGSGRVIFDQHLKQLQRRRLAKSNAPGLRAQAIVSDDMTALLLSGGGQWGAFGAGYMEELSRQQPSALPTVKFVTGVSTGALQSLYVAANQADAGKNWLADMRRHYSPQSEGEIVDRGSFLSALFTGSVAGLAPLRRKIETALCSSGEGASLQCPLIDALALEDAPLVLIGFVEARSGKMQFVLVQEIATAPIAPSEKQQCLAGAALASVAMPLHFQQVQIRSTPKGNPAAPLEAVTYYDGGVRQSVFFVLTDKIMAALARNDQAADRSGNAGATPSGDLPRTAYILRNGPTTAPLDQEVDQTASGLKAALRGYQLIVNQSEIASIAAMRPTFPAVDLFVATADGHDRAGGFKDPRPEIERQGAQSETLRCQKGTGKRKDMMFDPDFMRCLRAYGRFKANMTGDGRENGWVAIPDKAP